MICESVDLKSYVLGEGTREERGAVKAHLVKCASCREELARLENTHAALLSLRDEEIPRRIGFVSDGVFEPNWWQRLWRSGPQLGFAGAALLAAAILVHGFVAQRTVVVPAAPTVAAANPADIDKAVAAAVTKAVAESERRQQQRTAELLTAAEKKHQFELRAMQVAFEDDWRIKMKQLGTLYVALNRMEPGGGQ
jgi:anti-sigma factor RsiW